MNDHCWPNCDGRQEDERPAGVRPEAAVEAISGKWSATDPKRPPISYVFPRIESNSRLPKIDIVTVCGTNFGIRKSETLGRGERYDNSDTQEILHVVHNN